MKQEIRYKIMEILPDGKQNAISAEDLRKALQIRSIRELQRQIEAERNAGALILSSVSGGYYTSRDPSEIEEFIRTLSNRAKNTFAAVKSARRFLRMLDAERKAMCESSDNQPHDEQK